MGAHLRENRQRLETLAFKTNKHTNNRRWQEHSRRWQEHSSRLHDDGTGSPDGDDGWLAGEVRGGR